MTLVKPKEEQRGYADKILATYLPPEQTKTARTNLHNDTRSLYVRTVDNISDVVRKITRANRASTVGVDEVRAINYGALLVTALCVGLITSVVNTSLSILIVPLFTVVGYVFGRHDRKS